MVQVISTVGCAVEGAPYQAVGKECELYFDWSGLQVGVVAEVVSRDSTGRLGVKFQSLDREMQGRLKDICDALRERALAIGSTRQREAVTAADSVTTAGKAAKPAAAPAKTAAKPEAKRERRKVPRYVSDISARVANPSTGTDTEVTLIVLSVLGCCLEGSALPEKGQQGELTAEWEGRWLKIRGDVVWNSQGKKIGLKFGEIDKDAEKTLRQICSNLRIQPMGELPPEP